MKRILSFVAVGVVACLSLFAAINWNTVTNLAREEGVTVTVSSNPDAANAIVDDNTGAGWQANAATHPYTHDWVLIDLGSSKTFTDIEIYWEAAHCTSYSVYVTDEITYTPETVTPEGSDTSISYNAIAESWFDGKTPAYTGGNSEGVNYTDNIQFEQPQTGRYVLIYANEYNVVGETTYGMNVFEVKIANIEGRDEVSSLNIACEGNAVAGGDAVTVTVTPLSKIGETLAYNTITDLQLTCDNAAVTIAPVAGETGKYTVSASTYGDYTLTATAKAGDVTLTAEYALTVAYNWAGITNVATGKDIQGRVNPDTEKYPNNNPPANAVDNSLTTFYQYNGEWGGGDSWLLVDLGDVYNVEAIGVDYSNIPAGQPSKCIFGYATDASAILAKINEGLDFVWGGNLADVNAAWTFTNELDRKPGMVTTYVYDKPVIARYIAVRDANNPGGKPGVNNIYVKGTVREASKADHIDITLEKGGVVIGETNTVTASVVDQYGDPMTDVVPTINVTGATYADGTITCNTEGMVTVTATAAGVEAAEAKFYVANEDTYCITGVTVTASEGAADNYAAVIDGGKVITNNGEAFIIAPNETSGAHEHWILVKLAKPCDINLLVANWEGAAPADYDVYLGDAEENLKLFYSQRGNEGMKVNSDRFSGKEMKDIQYIKIITTKNATDYGIKLYDLKAYGTAEASVAKNINVTYEPAQDIAVGDEVTLSAKVLDQFGAEMPDAEVTYTCDNQNAKIEGNKFSATATGEYTVTAKCGEAEATVKINVSVVPAATTIELASSDNYIATDTPVTLTATVLDQRGNVMADHPEVTYSCDNSAATIDGDKFSASVIGNYTVKATCGSAESTIEIKVVVNANERVDYITAFPCTITLNGTETTQNIFAKVVPGVVPLQFGNTGTLVIEYTTPHNFSMIEFIWEAACPSNYTVTATYSDNTTKEILAVSDRVAGPSGVNVIDKILKASGASSNDVRRVVTESSDLNNITKLTVNVTGSVNEGWGGSKLLGIGAYSHEIATSVGSIAVDENMPVDVYNLQGIKVRENVKAQDALEGLPRGIYIVGGKKVIR